MNQQPQKPVFGATNPALHESHDTNWQELVQWIVGMFVLIGVIYISSGFIVEIISKKISDQNEKKWFSNLEQSLLHKLDVTGNLKNTPVETQEKFIRANALLSKLLTAQTVRNLSYTLHFSNTSSPNAFAIPGGSIALTEGLLTSLKTDMGLAMVLAHELGHHQHRDALRSMGRSILITTITSILMGGQSSLVNYALSFAEASNSRDQESAADAFGLKLVYATFSETKDSFEFFENLAADQASGAGKFASLFSSHPYSPDRYAQLKELEKDLLRKSKHN